MSTRRHGGREPGAHLLVAVKSLSDAKSRLSEDFSAPDRTALVLAMLYDTLTAATSTTAISAWSVVTPDERVAVLARGLGGDVIVEAQPDGTVDNAVADSGERLNAALTMAGTHIRRGWAGDIVVLQADLPALRAAEFDEAYDAAGRGTSSVVIDHTGSGTAALIHRDPESPLVPRFGPDSASRHIATGAASLGGFWPGLRLDVDTAIDLDAAAQLGLGPRTRTVLTGLGRLPVR